MKKSGLLIIAALFTMVTTHAQIGKSFTAEMKALLEASIEQIKGAKDERSTTTAYQSTLPLTGFKVLLKESFGNYRVTCSYDESHKILDSATASAMMDTIAIKLSKLRYIRLDSKKTPQVLTLNQGAVNVFNPVRKILLLDMEKNLKAELLLSDGKYPSLFISIYKFDRKILD